MVQSRSGCSLSVSVAVIVSLFSFRSFCASPVKLHWFGDIKTHILKGQGRKAWHFIPGDLLWRVEKEQGCGMDYLGTSRNIQLVMRVGLKSGFYSALEKIGGFFMTWRVVQYAIMYLFLIDLTVLHLFHEMILTQSSSAFSARLPYAVPTLPKLSAWLF